MPDSVAFHIAEGLIIADTYRLTRLIGRGGMGSVWEADHQRLPGKKVAVKVLSSDFSRDQETLLRFRREAEIASRLGHPNIVQIHDYNTLNDATPYLVLELLRGESLDARLSRGALSEPDTLRILREIGSALRVAHRAGVVHRDLKPQNVFLCDGTDGEPGATKVLDFGISKIRGSTTVKTQTETVLGTPQYMSPEQATGKHELVDARTDVFCLGIVAFEMLAGKPPFSGQNIPEVVFKIVYEPEPRLEELAPGVSPKVAAAVHKALAKERDDRFETIDDFLIALGLPASTSRIHQAESSPVALSETLRSDRQPLANLGIAETVDSGSARRSALNLAPARSTETGSPASTGSGSSRDGEGTSEPSPSTARYEQKVGSTWMPIILALLIGAGSAIAATVYMLRDPREKVAEAHHGKRRVSGAAASKTPAADERSSHRSDADDGDEDAPAASQTRTASAGDEPIPDHGLATPVTATKATADSEAPGHTSTDRTPAAVPEATKPHPTSTASSNPPEDPARDAPHSDPDPGDGVGGDEAAASSGDGPATAPIPGKAQLATIKSASARQRVVKALAALRKGDTATTTRLAISAAREGAGDVARTVEVIARCRDHQQMLAAAAVRAMSDGPVKRQLLRYCARKRVYIEP